MYIQVSLLAVVVLVSIITVVLQVKAFRTFSKHDPISEHVEVQKTPVLSSLSSPSPASLLNQIFTAKAASQFCHSDPGIIYSTTSSSRPSHRHCLGSCATQSPVFLPFAIEAPRLSSLCLLNPFHGFYDCIWPLVHYLTICLHLNNAVSYILTNNDAISIQRSTQWAAKAQRSFLLNVPRTFHLLEKSTARRSAGCICFKSIVRFRRSAFWRPTRFKFTHNTDSRFQPTIYASHPTYLKRLGLRLFRDSLINAIHLQPAERLEPNAPILIYGREDADRRVWRNARSFARLLRTAVPSHIRVIQISNIPTTFEEQARLFNRISVLVTPHGAALVNTLIMKEGASIIEIAGKHCLQCLRILPSGRCVEAIPGDVNAYDTFNRFNQSIANPGMLPTEFDLDITTNVTDPQSWLPWHAQSLGLNHLPAPCFKANGGYVTDNRSLLRTVLLALVLPRQ